MISNGAQERHQNGSSKTFCFAVVRALNDILKLVETFILNKHKFPLRIVGNNSRRGSPSTGWDHLGQIVHPPGVAAAVLTGPGVFGF